MGAKVKNEGEYYGGKGKIRTYTVNKQKLYSPPTSPHGRANPIILDSLLPKRV